MRLKPLLYLISIQYKIQVYPLPLRPPFPLIGFRSHHGPLFPSLPLGFPPPRPFPHPGHPPPIAAASALVAAEHGKPLAAMLPPPAAAAGPPRPGPGHGAASLFSVLTSAASAGPAGGVAEAGSSLPDPSPDTNTEMTLKNNDSCEPEDPGNLHHCEDVQPPPSHCPCPDCSASTSRASDSPKPLSGLEEAGSAVCGQEGGSSSAAAAETVYETAARLLFMSVRWTKNLASFSALAPSDQVTCDA